MNWFWFSIAVIATLAVLRAVSWVARAIRRQEDYDDLLPIDYGAFEADLINHVHDLNKVKH